MPQSPTIGDKFLILVPTGPKNMQCYIRFSGTAWSEFNIQDGIVDISVSDNFILGIAELGSPMREGFRKIYNGRGSTRKTTDLALKYAFPVQLLHNSKRYVKHLNDYVYDSFYKLNAFRPLHVLGLTRMATAAYCRITPDEYGGTIDLSPLRDIVEAVHGPAPKIPDYSSMSYKELMNLFVGTDIYDPRLKYKLPPMEIPND